MTMKDKVTEPDQEELVSKSEPAAEDMQGSAAEQPSSAVKEKSSAAEAGELTPRQARIKARAERQKRIAARRANQASPTDAEGLSQQSLDGGEENTEAEEPPLRRKKRRDVLAAARRQTEYIQKTQGKKTPPMDEDPALADAVSGRALVPKDRKDEVLAPPPPKSYTEAEREAEIAQIQRELVLRRRRRWAMLWLRIAFFILLPTFLVSNYFYNYATPLYAAKTAFVIERGASPSSVATGGMFSGTALVTARESISVQEFLISREAMRIVDDELGILEHYRDPSLDAIQRLAADASENTAYGVYKDRVLVGFDTTEGIIRLETIAVTPEMATAKAERLIALAEGRVDTMSSRSRQDAVQAAQDAVDEIDQSIDDQFEVVLKLQEELGIFSPAAEISLVQGQIAALTSELEIRRLELRKLLENARPNAAQERVLRAEIAFFEDAIDERRGELIGSSQDQASLARVTADLERAQNDLALLEAARAIALETSAMAEREAAQQSLYLAMVVNPVLPEVSSYPRSFEYTLLAFVIFFALYMIASLTVSILREQMSYGTHS